VMTVTPEMVSVVCPDGRSFEYWHIAATVSNGDHVETDSTVLGHILREAGHVHLTELDGRVPVDPLAPGHLTPYADTTAPTVTSISFRGDTAGGDLMPEILRGRIEIVAPASDLPSMPVAGTWRDLPVTPALIEWHIRRADSGRIVVPSRIAYDVRAHLPALNDFWRVYARGTHQNMSVFGKHYSFMQPGVYLFRLTPGGFDTHTLPDGFYEVVVNASDIRGNHSSAVQRFSIHNRPGVTGV